MAYSPLPAKVTTDPITITNYDAIKGNFEAGVPDIFTTKGDIAAATGADAAGRLAVGPDDSELTPDASQATGLAWQIKPGVRAYNNAALSPTVNVWTALTFNSERYDTDAMHSTSSNTSRLTVPAAGAGLYLIGANAEFNTSGLAGGNGQYGLRLLLNGTTVIGQTRVEHALATALALQVQTMYSLAVADYVEVQAFQSTSVTVLSTANYSPEFWAQWMRRQ